MHESSPTGSSARSAASELPRPRPASARGIERLREHWDDPRVRIGALLVAALVTGLVWYQLGVRQSAGRCAAPRRSRRPPRRPASTRVHRSRARRRRRDPAGRSWSTSPATWRDRASCASQRGRSRSSTRSRPRAAGCPDADLDRLNLAAKVADGQRVAVGEDRRSPRRSRPERSRWRRRCRRRRRPARSTSTRRPPRSSRSCPASVRAWPRRSSPSARSAAASRPSTELQDVRGIGELRYADIKDLVSV